MTVRKGDQWGRSVDRPDDLVTVDSDVALAAMVVGGHHPPVSLSGGDLYRAIGGGRRPGAPGTQMRRVEVDLLRVELDGRHVAAVAHVVARRSWWRGQVVAVCNAEHLGRWDIAPRAHPNDGRADIIEVSPAMTVRERVQAWRRLPAGTHVPHPRIAVSRSAGRDWQFDPPVSVWVDGRRHRRVGHLRVTVEADAFHLHI